MSAHIFHELHESEVHMCDLELAVFNARSASCERALSADLLDARAGPPCEEIGSAGTAGEGARKLRRFIRNQA
jgi:hypothetical protein